MWRGAVQHGVDERAAATAVWYHIVYASVQCGKPRRVETQRERKIKRVRARKGLAASRGERGGRHREKKEKEEGTTRRSSI